ncbi:MAG: hypothetical protein MZW92_77885 [Comamonadaceae bacterium]|nr:hypothetical protein [Comamonadaceae bacterium]
MLMATAVIGGCGAAGALKGVQIEQRRRRPARGEPGWPARSEPARGDPDRPG